MRVLDPRELCHDRLADRFGELLSNYDTQRRLETLVDEFLTVSAANAFKPMHSNWPTCSE